MADWLVAGPLLQKKSFDPIEGMGSIADPAVFNAVRSLSGMDLCTSEIQLALLSLAESHFRYRQNQRVFNSVLWLLPARLRWDQPLHATR